MTRKIIIILPTPIAVGDLTMMQSLFLFLKEKNPGVILDVIAAQKTPELIFRMPEIRRVISSPLTHGKLDLRLRYRLARLLRAEKYDQAITLSTSFKAGLVPWLARIPIRTGFRRKWGVTLLNDTQLLPRPRLPRMIQRFLSVASKPREIINEKLYWPKIKTDSVALETTLKKYQISSESIIRNRILVLCPGSTGGMSKRWPIDYFAKLSQHFL